MWARLSALQHFSWHAVRTIDGGSVQTFCRGRWAVAEPYETEKRPPRVDQCAACNRAMDPVERGLAELRDSQPLIGGR